MRDTRFQALAAQLAGYSTTLRPGDRVLLELTDIPEEMGIALIREVRAAGAMPFLRLNQSRLNREMLSGATEEQYGIIGRHRLAEMEEMDAYIEIRGGGNAFELSAVPQKNMAVAMKALNPVSQRRIRHTRWCGLRWPSEGMAQQAAMSTEEFEDFYFRTCLMDYGALRPAMQKLAAMMEAAEHVRITGPGTDISFSIKGLPAIPCAGECNLPDGEVFTAPVIDSANGRISFNTPSLFQGIPFDNISLTLENGLVVHAEAGDKTAELNSILDTDPGARRLGEFAFGVNPAITRPMRNILFDEKISGSFHLTPGQAYHVADNGNQSRIHWDMVCIQTAAAGGGDIYLDGVLVLSDVHTNLPLLEKAAAMAEQARPDMIVFLGDLYTDFLRATHAGDYITQMKRLSSIAPAYACLGNHDMALVDNVERILKEGGFTLLRNSAAFVTIPRLGNAEFKLVGLGDLREGDFFPDRCMSPRELGEESVMPTIVLSHNPKGRELLGGYHWNLMLSGHTHGGQIKLPFFSTPLLTSEGETMYSGFHPYEDKQVFVTRGIGYIGPGRFNCPPEINLITIP